MTMGKVINEITQVIQEASGLSPEFQGKVFGSLVVAVVLWVLKSITIKFVVARQKDPRALYHWQKVLGYVFFVVGAFIITRIWFAGIQPIATFLGLVSAGLAISLQSPLVNLAGWSFILWRKPFEVGDRIQLGDHKGDVIDQRLFMFTLMEIGNWVDADQSTGRIINVPNGKVFSDVLANYSKGFEYLWNELPVLVTFESDWEKARGILQKIAEKHSIHLSKAAENNLKKVAQKMMIFYNTLTPTVYVSVADSGVMLTIRYLCHPKSRRGSSQDIWVDILRAFAAEDGIDFAYPTQRFYMNLTEGKDGTKPPNLQARLANTTPPE